MSVRCSTSYNMKARPFVVEDMASWLPPTLCATALWPVFCGFSTYSRNYWVCHRDFDSLDMEIVTKGDLTVYCDGRVAAVLRPGEIGVMPFGSHKLETGPAGRCEKIGIGICGLALRVLVKTMKLDSFFVLHDFLTPEITVLLHRIHDLLKGRKMESVNEISILAYTFLLEVVQKRQTAEYPPELLDCIHFINQNIFQKITLDEMAEHTGCGKTTLSRLFKKHLGTTPLQFLIDKRINYAVNLLESGTVPVKEVASLCGYQNQLYFSNDFRKHTGLSPSRYRGAKR